MNLYSYLEENLDADYAWEDYTFDEADIPELKGNFELLCSVWEQINEWGIEYADECRGVDAALIAKILTETLHLINYYTENEMISVQIAADLCSIYGRCCIFAKNPIGGSEYFEKCKFVVNNTISEAVLSKKHLVVELSDIDNADVDAGWERL